MLIKGFRVIHWKRSISEVSSSQQNSVKNALDPSVFYFSVTYANKHRKYAKKKDMICCVVIENMDAVESENFRENNIRYGYLFICCDNFVRFGYIWYSVCQAMTWQPMLTSRQWGSEEFTPRVPASILYNNEYGLKIILLKLLSHLLGTNNLKPKMISCQSVHLFSIQSHVVIKSHPRFGCDYDYW